MAGVAVSLFIYLAFLIAIPVAIGVYVYRDASQRGMNAALWTLISVLAPLFVGFIIYLLARGSYPDLKCPNCDAAVTEQYVVCPRCGAKLKETCPQCGFAVEGEWTACPRCASPLAHADCAVTPPVKKQDKALGKILLLVVLIPLLLLVFIGLLSFGAFQSTGSLGTAYLDAAYFEDNPQVSAWIETCAKDPDGTYALCYQEETGEEKTTVYLLYRPAASEDTDISTSVDSGFFGTDVKVSYNAETSPDSSGYALTGITYRSDQFAGLKVYLEDKSIDCQITEVNFDPLIGEL